MSDEMSPDREFHFSDKDFKLIREFVKEHTGISLSEAKRNMVYGRLSRRLRRLKLSSFKEYIAMLDEPSSDELGHFINAMTTNLTSFFREGHHFEYLANTIVPQLIKNNMQTRRIRVWSAGCSTGEEPYSLAITLLSAVPDPQNWDIKILATDLDTNVIAHGERGVYDEERIAGIPSKYKKGWFLRGKGENEGTVRLVQSARELITFRKLNLMQTWPMKGPFDVIFCRNVVIYFEKETQRKLFDRYADMLIPHGHIFLGHSESLFKVSTRFELVGNTIYRKKD